MRLEGVLNVICFTPVVPGRIAQNPLRHMACLLYSVHLWGFHRSPLIPSGCDKGRQSPVRALSLSF